jgi:hypothetical protein
MLANGNVFSPEQVILDMHMAAEIQELPLRLRVWR